MDLKAIERKLKDQAHVLEYWDELSYSQKMVFSKQLDALDVEELNKAFQETLNPSPPCLDEITQIPEDRYLDRNTLPQEERDRFYNRGLKAIADGEVGAIVLAGGQASRLGADKPKGILPLGIGLTKTDSLLAIQALQIARLIKLAKERYPESSPRICWLIMTSQSTHADTQAHTEKVIAECGLNRDDVILFTQFEIPSFDTNGKFLLKAKNCLATAPDGNGGIYKALQPLLADLEKRGLKYFHIYCVDNILCKVADPHFIGSSIEMNADCAAKVIEKKHPDELVGNLCKEKGHVKVLEYSEISKKLAEMRDDSGRLYLRAGSIANHFFTLDFIKVVCDNLSFLQYHVAKKKIAHIDLTTGELVKPDKPNGIKLERLIFDAFYFSERFLVWQVAPTEEFSPLKNPESAGVDCLSTCLRDFVANDSLGLRGN